MEVRFELNFSWPIWGEFLVSKKKFEGSYLLLVTFGGIADPASKDSGISWGSPWIKFFLTRMEEIFSFKEKVYGLLLYVGYHRPDYCFENYCHYINNKVCRQIWVSDMTASVFCWPNRMSLFGETDGGNLECYSFV